MERSQFEFIAQKSKCKDFIGRRYSVAYHGEIVQGNTTLMREVS